METKCPACSVFIPMGKNFAANAVMIKAGPKNFLPTTCLPKKKLKKFNDIRQKDLEKKFFPNAMINGDKLNLLLNTSSICFDYVEVESILFMMNELGICASSGSACTSWSLESSHVLRAMGRPFTAAHGSIRFSLSAYRTEAEIEFVIEKLPRIIERLREMSPFWRQRNREVAMAV
jgi:cysteine desulfurase